MNLPNLLTIFRLVLIPVFVSVYFSGHPQAMLQSLGIFLLAGATDVADGYIARRWNMQTTLGTVLDPLADKLMLITVLYCLTLTQSIPSWIVILVGLKEAFMIVSGLVLYFRKVNQVVIPSNLWGKMATTVFYIAVAANLTEMPNTISAGTIILATLLTFVALVNYSIIYYQNHHGSVGE